MSATIIKTLCKVCKHPLDIKIASNAEPHWQSQLLPMATCNSCFDIISEYRAAETVIRKLCGMIIHKKLLGKIERPRAGVPPSMATATFALCRDAMIPATKKYALAVMRFHGESQWFWSEDMADILLENPAKWWAALNEYRKQAAIAFQAPSLNPFDKPEAKTPLQILADELMRKGDQDDPRLSQSSC